MNIFGCLLLFILSVNGKSLSLSLTEPKNYTIDKSIYQNAKKIQFEIWGAGGAGGTCISYVTSVVCGGCASGGGGSGAYVRLTLDTNVDDVDQIFIITVGKGGVFNTDNNNGESSIIHNIINNQSIIVGGGLSGINKEGGSGGKIIKNDMILEIDANGKFGDCAKNEGFVGNVPNDPRSNYGGFLGGDIPNEKASYRQYRGGDGGASYQNVGNGRGAVSFNSDNLEKDGKLGGGGGGAVIKSDIPLFRCLGFLFPRCEPEYYVNCNKPELYLNGGNGGDGLVIMTFIE
jgi:hypothetical protein